jgi:deoxyhypusine synthase
MLSQFMTTQQRKPKMSKYLTTPTRPVQVDRDRSINGILEKMEGAGMGARALAEAHRIWLDALGDSTTIYLSAAGDLIPAGMRRLLSYVIKNRFVDVLVISGEMLFQDLHETLGRKYYQAHAAMSDTELEASAIVRLDDVLCNFDEYREADEWIGGFASQLDASRSYSVREFLHLLGRELAEIVAEDGIMTSAYKSRVPIFCPDLANSQMCVGIAQARFEKKNVAAFDIAQDTLEMMHIANRSRSTCLLTFGDIQAKSLAQLSEVAVSILKMPPRGHKYSVTIAPQVPQFCGRQEGSLTDMTNLFGRTTKNAQTTFVQCDASIALPIVITALSQTAVKYMKGRKRPNFGFAGKDLQIEIS